MSEFRYLNAGGLWPLTERRGLVVSESELRLATEPGLPALLFDGDGLSAGSGLARTPAGDLFLADGTARRVWRVDGCDGTLATFFNLDDLGAPATEVPSPAGLWWDGQERLLVADPAGHRVLVLDGESGQLLAVWGTNGSIDAGGPSAETGRFNTPVAITGTDEHLFIVETGNNRIQRFDMSGNVEPAFWESVLAGPVTPTAPVSSAVIAITDEPRLLVLESSGTLLFYTLAGNYDAATSDEWSGLSGVGSPVAALLVAGRLLVASGEQLLTFDSAAAIHHMTPFAEEIVALQRLETETVLVLTSAGAVWQLEPAGAYAACGTFLLGPVESGHGAARWQRVQLLPAAQPADTRLQLFTLTSNTLDGSGTNRPAFPAVCGQPAGGEWQATPVNGTDFLIGGEPATYLWLAGRLQGNGQATPRLAQVWVTFDESSWLDHLPALYRRQPTTPTELEPFLRLLAGAVGDSMALLAQLPRLFDADGAPDQPPEGWLDWLANWLAFELDEGWTTDERRAALSQAFALQGQRGTVDGLRLWLELYAGVNAHVVEPAQTMAVWSLGEVSTLGFDTTLAAADPDGAIVGTTAVVDQSHLKDAYGSALFDDTAHRFCVAVYAGNMGGGDGLARVEQVIEQEKPAHTDYHLCVLGATMRVGFQARIGIDSIVGSRDIPLKADGTSRLGMESSLEAGTGPAQLRLT